MADYTGFTHQYDIDGMRGKAEEIKHMGRDYEQLMSRMTTLINNLETVWNAPATRGFKENYEQFQRTFQNFENKMLDYAAELRRAADVQEEKDARDLQSAAKI